jgi:hypothetical protein
VVPGVPAKLTHAGIDFLQQVGAHPGLVFLYRQ